jgi:nucleoside-diphosphate-sugar epimerase
VSFRNSSNPWRIKDILPSLELFKADLRCRDDVASAIRSFRPDIVFHLATYGGYHFQKDERTILEANVLGTHNLLMALEETGCEKLVAAGSSSEYGGVEGPMREDQLPVPANVYGAAKVSATMLCQTYAKLGKVPNTVLRLFSPYGPYEELSRLIPSTILSVLSGRPLDITEGRQTRDFVFIDDTTDALIKAAGSGDCTGEVFNVGSGNETTIRSLVEKIVELTGREAEIHWGAVSYRENELWHWFADISKTRRILGWSPKVGLDSGLKDTIDWFEKNLQICEEASG